MKKKRISINSIVLILLIITSILLGYTVVRIAWDISNVREEAMEESLDQSSYMHAKQLSQLFSSRLNEIESLASCAAEFNRNDTEQLNRILQGHNDSFKRMGFIDIYGNGICGWDFGLNTIQNETFYNDLISGKGIITEKLYMDASGDRGFYFLAPVMQQNRTQMIIVGCYTEVSLVQSMDSAEYVGSGCVCFITKDGDYVVGGRYFDEILGSKERNHFSHIGNTVSSQLEEAMADGESLLAEYRYAGIEYEASYVPMGVNNWYLAVTIPLQEEISRRSILTNETQVLLLLLALFCISLFIGILLLLIQSRHQKRVIYRNELLQQCDGGISFELSFKPHVLRFYGDIKSMIGTDPGDLVGEAVYDVYDWIHEDDTSVRSRLHQFFDSGEERFSTEVRVRNFRGNYGWYRIVGIMQKKQGHISKPWFVGKIINVDEEVAEEKDLMQRAENDLLTGVLNKKTMEKRISLMLKNAGGKYVIFYMIDLDNFKNVNDTLGHIYGDQAIIETAQALNKVFAEQDCVGRLGGDEFAACVIYNAFDERNLLDFIKKKGETICQVNRRTYTDGASEVSITSSVGIAYAPDMGGSFEELYKKADRALYYSKENGKNRYHIYKEGD